MKSVQTIRGVQTPKGFASGGMVSGNGTGTSDSIPVNLSNGESVINAQSTSMFKPLLSTLNQMGGGKPFEPNLSSSQSSSDGNTPIIKTYVVAGDVETQNQLDRQIKSRSIL